MSRNKHDDWWDRITLTAWSFVGLLSSFYLGLEDGRPPFMWFCYACAVFSVLCALFRLWRERAR